MITYTPTQYNDILFNKLPQEVRDVVMNSDTTRALWAIGEKRKLHIDQVGIMHDMAMDVMMGIIASKNFVGELQKELQISAFDASALARDIDEEIFKPIKSTMIKIYGDGAPYKPSSSLVQFTEDDEDHKELDKDALLREIENPTEVTTRVETVMTTSTALETQEEVKELKEMESKAGINTTSSVAVATPPSREESDSPLEGSTAYSPGGMSSAAPKMESMLEKIASMKLNKTFVMPKGDSLSFGEGQGEASLEAHLPSSSQKEEVKKKVEESNAAPYTPPAPKSYAADPYREPLA